MGNIIIGDSIIELPKMQDNSIDVGFTSPPYNRKRNDKYAEYDDCIDNYYGFLTSIIDEMMRICKKWVFFNIQATYYNRGDVYRLIGEYADCIQNIIIWNKKNPMPANGFNITNAYEFIIVFGTDPLESNNTYTQNHISTSVNNDMPDIHKAVMPLEVAEWVITSFTKQGDIVLDPFFGTGTTGVACKKFNRDYIGIEKSTQYAEYSRKRIDGTLHVKDTNQITIDEIFKEDSNGKVN